MLEANRLGCDVVGTDINPMAYWIVRQEIIHLNLASYRKAGFELIELLRARIGDLYTTKCINCDSVTANVKYFIWVKDPDVPRVQQC